MLASARNTPVSEAYLTLVILYSQSMGIPRIVKDFHVFPGFVFNQRQTIRSKEMFFQVLGSWNGVCQPTHIDFVKYNIQIVDRPRTMDSSNNPESYSKFQI